jgi:trimeric autotransporter adhesin
MRLSSPRPRPTGELTMIPLHARQRYALRLPLAITIMLFALSSATAWAQSVRPDLWIADGPVSASAISGNVLYIAGSFTQVGPPTGAFATIDAATGEAIVPFPRVSGGAVTAVVSDGSGGWFIGGQFTTVGGLPRAGLAHLKPDGTPSGWNPNPSGDGVVTALARSGSLLYVGGGFSTIGGQFREKLAALDVETGNATPWNPTVTYSMATAEINAIVVSGSTIYVAGNFDYIGGQIRRYIAALDAAGSAIGWNPDANAEVNAIVVNGSAVYAGGSFTSIGGETRNGLAVLATTNGAAGTWNPAPNGTVASLALGGVMYVGGSFSTIGGQTRSRLAAVNLTTGAATSWNPAPNGSVTDIEAAGSIVYVAGGFTDIGAMTRSRLAALTAADGTPTTWKPAASGLVSVLAVDGSRVAVGGSFRSVGGQARRWVAALDLDTGGATSWNPVVTGDSNGNLSDIEVDGSAVYLAGTFSSVNDESRFRAAAVDRTTGAALPWNPNANGDVFDLAVGNGVIYAAGRFTAIGGFSRNRLAALDPVSAVATSWDPNPVYAPMPFATTVTTVEVIDGVVYASGDFLSIGGQSRQFLAALDATTGNATGWAPNPDQPADDFVLDGSVIYVGGGFSTIGGLTRHGLAAVNATTGTALASFDAHTSGAHVSVLTLNDGTLFVGGNFTSMGGQPRNHLAAVDASNGNATVWNPNPKPNNSELGGSGLVSTMSLSGGELYVGGRFTDISDLPQSYVAGVNAVLLAGVEPHAAMPLFLSAGYPNPFRARASIPFSLPRATEVSASVYDVAGREVAVLARNRSFGAGSHSFTFDGRGMRDGIYLCRVRAAGHESTIRMALLH